MPKPNPSCVWCGRPLTERSRFGSKRYGLARRGLHACDSCLDKGTYEQPPPGWYSNEEWSVGPPSVLSPNSYLARGFGLALFVTALMVAWLTIEDLAPLEITGLISVYFIGAACAFVTPLKLRDNSRDELWRYAWVGILVYISLRALDRIGDRYALVDAALACVLSLACGWFALLAIRGGFANRRHGLRSHGGQGPPASDTDAP